MANDQNESSQQVAQQVAGAIKTGKAIAGLAKGASFGAYGALAAAVWENKETIVKIVVSATFLLVLPILFLLMLPSIIFNGLVTTHDIPIMNDNSAIISYMSEAGTIIQDALYSAHEKALDQIRAEIGNLGENETGIIVDTHAASIYVNSNLILSQYCAYKEKDYQNINLNDLKNVVAAAAGELYSYSKSTSSYVDDETEETHYTHTYTVHYAGDDYFAANVFRLSDDQIALALEYAQNLNLFLYGSYNASFGTANVSDDVLRYEPLIRQYAEIHGIPQYVEVIKAIMMQESGGRQLDVMQSSECPLNTRYPNVPGGITDPEYSIDVGIAYFASCLSQAGCSSPADMNRLSLALQGYNFGGGYITWALSNYGGYSEANAAAFSEMKKQQLGWPRYGDTQYVAHVLRYYNPGGAFGSPFVGKNWRDCVTSEYGYRTSPISGNRELHSGIDIAYPLGTPINAIGGGTVTRVQHLSTGYGYNVTIDHGNGVSSLYAHCSSILVAEGQQVRQGDVIALVGSTGASTGNHLHLTIYVNGELKNPREYIS